MSDTLYVDVIFPLALPMAYTYSVPAGLINDVVIGKRIEAPIKNKLYAGLILDIHHREPTVGKTKDIISILDTIPIVNRKQLDLWQWISKYYCCTMGEVMQAALPSSLKLESETKVVARYDLDEIDLTLTDDEYMVAEAISIQNELTIAQIQDILNRKTIYPIIRSLMDMGIVSIKEELIQKYKPKLVSILYLNEPFCSSPDAISLAYELVTKSDRQSRALLAFAQVTRMKEHFCPMHDVMAIAEVDSSVINSMVKKGIFTIKKEEKSRVSTEIVSVDDLPKLSEPQRKAIGEIRGYFDENKPVMLHGVTGSGKTRVYSELIMDALAKGRQVLYLLPEIALTSHLVERLRANIPASILVYHSRLNNNERVDIWKEVSNGANIVVSARSGLFLPFHDLGLVIIDEEHDPSYKQQDPSPRYNARDAALVLARSHGAPTILGTATPSLESYYNVFKEKYGLVALADRHGEAVLPIISLVDLKKSKNDKRYDGLLSFELQASIKLALDDGEQVILFQNRRGYAPNLTCSMCGWVADCANCDVHQTYHKTIHMLKCHYCGAKQKKPRHCPKCGSVELVEEGYGTERIEEHIAQYFPDARLARLDMDTAKTKYAFDKIIHEFENREIDILIGTQMIAKGLDFDNISLVGVINADGMLRYPDFRSSERAFQLLTQVSGRAGRRAKQGQVIIQTFAPEHPVLYETVHQLYGSFYQREIAERKNFVYPPVFNLIEIQLAHKSVDVVKHAATTFAELLRPKLANRILGPVEPPLARVRGQYLMVLLIKFEKDPKIAAQIKSLIETSRETLKTIAATKAVKVIIDVDPY